MINCAQLRDLIIKPALEDLILYSDDALELMIFTCATESQGGTFLHQVKGPALGIFQMEPETYNDLWINFIAFRNDFRLRLIHGFGIQAIPSEDRLIYDLRFASAMTRIFYERIQEPLPNANDIDAIWEYYKKYYNTSSGKAYKGASILQYQLFKSN